MSSESQHDGNEALPEETDGLKNPADLFRFAMEAGNGTEPSGSHGSSTFSGSDTDASSLDDFKILNKIADGGMASVYRARQLSLNREVALKMMSGHRAMDPALMDRFLIEAEAVGRLDHPHIVPIHQVGAEHIPPYYAMRLIEGGNLGGWMRRLRESDTFNPADYMRAVSVLMEKVARAVHFAHQRGIIHRDLKPGNILVDAEDEPHVTDFGLAKFVEQDSGLTQTNAIMGTPAYMAPEQAEGRNEDVSVATDVYSLGTVFYELLTGVVPFFGEFPAQTMHKVIHEDPVSPSMKCDWIERDLEIICLKAMRKETSLRYASALEWAEDLRRWREGYPILARDFSVSYRFRRFAKRHRQGLAVAGVALFCVIGLSVFAWTDRNKQRDDDLVSRLMSSKLEAVPELLEQHGQLSSHVLRSLQSFRDSPDREQQTKALLGLIPYEKDVQEAVKDLIGSAEPELLKSISDRYTACGMDVSSWLFERLKGPGLSIAQKLRHAGLLAMQSGTADFSDNEYEALALELIAQPSSTIGEWVKVCFPLREELMPHLKHVFDKVGQTRASVNVSHLLSKFAEDDPATLCELVLLADPYQMEELLTSLKNVSTNQWGSLKAVAERNVSLEGDVELRTAEINQQKRAVIALFMLGDNTKLLSEFEDWMPEDPRLRTALIHGLAEYNVNPRSLIPALTEKSKSGVVQGILSALGDYDLARLGTSERDGLKPLLESYYRDSEQAGVRSMAEWLLRRWELADGEELARLDAEGNYNSIQMVKGTWTLAPLGIAMVAIPEPEPFLMGSTTNEFGFRPEEARHWRKIPRSYAIAAKPITFQQFSQFDPDFWKGYLKLDNRAGELAGPDPRNAIERVSLDEMRLFCNWLSKLDGMEEDELCYRVTEKGKILEKNDLLLRFGYRLPTEAEWESACRAGSLTARFFGDDDRLLTQYALYDLITNERPYLCDNFRPNVMGLFGLYGPYKNTCYGYAEGYPSKTSQENAAMDSFGPDGPSTQIVFRGGMHKVSASNLRSAFRLRGLGVYSTQYMLGTSLRIARTILQP